MQSFCYVENNVGGLGPKTNLDNGHGTMVSEWTTVKYSILYGKQF